ncbi:type 4 pilus major pilin [Burkholderia stabilis]|uniref:type 4 pilus major pilin n=1 Tax=Burkholderia stabilis TaxID=95485 RepID=UPI001F4B8511|nr:type 4 pilus major pilin [Burkholderia stabilis]
MARISGVDVTQCDAPALVESWAMKNKRRNTAQRGSVLVEYGLYLLVALIAVVGLYAYFNTSSVGEQTNQLGSDLTALAGKVKSSYAGQYANVTNGNLDTGGFFKGLTSMSDNAGTVTTAPGGGQLTVSSGTLIVAGDSVQYKVTNLPDAACQPILSAIQRGAAKITINATVIKSPTVTFNPANMTCTGDTNTLTYLMS